MKRVLSFRSVLIGMAGLLFLPAFLWGMSAFLMPVFAAPEKQAADITALRLAVEDLTASHPGEYPNGPRWLEQIAGLEKELSAAPGNAPAKERLEALKQQALLANPLLDGFGQILVIKRKADDPSLGLPQNWQGNCSLPLHKYHNEIALFSPRGGNAPLKTLFKPEKNVFIGDVDLNFDGERLLFSMPGSHGRSQIWEIRADGSGLRQVTPGDEPDVDNYDACYLPDGRVIYGSTACYQGIPCVAGSDSVANLCVMNADGTGARRLCFDQDHDWSPTVLGNGRVLYTRWEYTDLPHSNTRLLFHMNPDGTGQMEYYGSNSYWPTSVMYARPVPDHPTAVAAVVTGHHGVPRMGELVVLDPARGRSEADGAVRRIPGRGKAVEPVIMDNLVDNSWPKFLHPFPLSDKYFLAACQPTPSSLWGIYLVDAFDNMLLLREEPGWALLEPVPLRATPRPPVIPDKVKPGEKEAVVYIANIYEGPGLAGVPEGTVKSLRLVSYSYAYRKTGGLLGVVGMDGPWDVKRILGTVPVEPDGSALFRVPANTPVSVQPLDAQGRAMQLMRSWFTGMPGEAVSCAGCHERQNSTPPARNTLAARRAPSEVTPWRGPARGFSFAREVQPVLDRYCLECHDGGKKADATDLRGNVMITDWKSDFGGNGGGAAGKFSVAYASLHRFVRRPGIESDYHLLKPMEFHAGTTELAQMLEQGHYGVSLDPEAWDRLNTWIDLNAPYHGTWSEIYGADTLRETVARQRELDKKYAGLETDYEAVHPAVIAMPDAPPRSEPPKPAAPPAPDAPAGTGGETKLVDLGDGMMMEMVRVPAGSLFMDCGDGAPTARTAISRNFWLGRFEVTNEQYARFDPNHDSGVESMHAYQFGIHGHPLNGPKQPVVRVSWEDAMAFCRWLSERTGEAFALPTEAQWEHACRAGTATPFSFGGFDTDFSAHANLGDARLRDYALETYIQVHLIPNPGRYDDWVPKDARFNDGTFLSAEAGRYTPNPWGLCDMHGNVWEWTLSAYRPYPYNDGDGRNDPTLTERRVVRGGSWYDRPYRAASSFRLGYEAWQPVFNTGFRVACPAD